MKGLRPPVWEIRADYFGGTYRLMYVVQLARAVYVLHVFQKKATIGIATPRVELDLIRRRMKLAEAIDAGGELAGSKD